MHNLFNINQGIEVIFQKEIPPFFFSKINKHTPTFIPDSRVGFIKTYAVQMGNGSLGAIQQLRGQNCTKFAHTKLPMTIRFKI